jgi:hypothetical protein
MVLEWIVFWVVEDGRPCPKTRQNVKGIGGFTLDQGFVLWVVEVAVGFVLMLCDDFREVIKFRGLALQRGDLIVNIRRTGIVTSEVRGGVGVLLTRLGL